jgi:hypothetical protein
VLVNDCRRRVQDPSYRLPASGLRGFPSLCGGHSRWSCSLADPVMQITLSAGLILLEQIIT